PPVRCPHPPLRGRLVRPPARHGRRPRPRGRGRRGGAGRRRAAHHRPPSRGSRPVTGSAGTPGPTTATARQAVGGFLRRWRALLVLLLVFAVGVLVIGPRGTPGPPYDPTSTSPRGARGLVLLLEEVGLDVRISADPPGAGVDTDPEHIADLLDVQHAHHHTLSA